MNNISEYVLNSLFNKYVHGDGEVVYWRDCILKPDMVYGSQGYIWIFSDGEHFHSYRTPEMVFGQPSAE